jgi:predicted  nucleic acid-binding Zn-ribbon protein
MLTTREAQGVPLPLSKASRRPVRSSNGPTTTAASPAAGSPLTSSMQVHAPAGSVGTTTTTVHRSGVLVTRHSDPVQEAQPQQAPLPVTTSDGPLKGRVQLMQPALVEVDAVRDFVADALGLPLDTVRVESVSKGSITIDFSVRHARHVYPDDRALAAHLAGDAGLRTALSKLTRVHRGQHFTFVVCDPHMSDRAWSLICSAELFPLIDRALHYVTQQPPGTPAEALYIAFAEAVAPHETARLKRELADAVADVVDMRVELSALQRQTDTRQLEKELDEEIRLRKDAERRYQTAMTRESQLKAELSALQVEAERSRPEVRRMRLELRQLEEENKKLEAQRVERQAELDALRADTGQSIDRLAKELDEAERELGLWRQRCTDLEREREASQRSYHTSEESLKLTLARTERRLFEAQQARAVVGRAIEHHAHSTFASSSGSASDGNRERSTSPRRSGGGGTGVGGGLGASLSLRHEGSVVTARNAVALADATATSASASLHLRASASTNAPAPSAPTTPATAVSPAETAARLEDLQKRLQRTESHLRERTLQLAQALKENSAKR